MPSVGEVEERIFRVRQDLDPVLGTDRTEVVVRGPVAGEKQVVAVIDIAPQARVVERPAAAAGLCSGLVETDPKAGLGQPDRCRQTGQPRADDVDRLFYRADQSAPRIPRQSFSPRPIRPIACQPAASIRSRYPS